MDFEGDAAAEAGILAGLIMTAILYMGIALMPRQMKMNLLLLLGTMMFNRGPMAYMAGAMAHAAMSIVFALIHVAIFNAAGLEDNLAAWGLLFGFVHWLIVGMALGMMPVMHRGIKEGVIQAPGAYATAYPAMTTMGFLMLHLVYGVLVGAFYTAFA